MDDSQQAKEANILTSVQYCPTQEMIADFFTKPLQGALFYKFCDAVLGIDAKDFDEYRRKCYETLKKYQLMDEKESPGESRIVGPQEPIASSGPQECRNIDEIEFQFFSEANPAAATRLNDSYSELLSPTAIECKDLFIRHSDDEPMILAPDPLTNLTRMVLKIIEANLWYMADILKDHITQLLANCTITAIKSMNSNEPKKLIRGQTDLDDAARAAVEPAATNGEWESIVFIEVSIDRWRFKPNWNASLFIKIYEDQSVTVPSPPATIPSNTKDSNLPSSVRAPTPTDPPSTVRTPSW
eukprot:jgi/Psemu1/36490/gm1.36490_g